jgi:hypothetical protein
MVERRQSSPLETMVKERPLMVVIIMLPCLSLFELARFCQLNKKCKEVMVRVNFKVLCEGWGVQLTPDEVKETKVSTSRAF